MSGTDEELREVATLMALTMPLVSPEEEAMARRVEEKQEQWAGIWRSVFAAAQEAEKP